MPNCIYYTDIPFHWIKKIWNQKRMILYYTTIQNTILPSISGVPQPFLKTLNNPWPNTYQLIKIFWFKRGLYLQIMSNKYSSKRQDENLQIRWLRILYVFCDKIWVAKYLHLLIFNFLLHLVMVCQTNKTFHYPNITISNLQKQNLSPIILCTL